MKKQLLIQLLVLWAFMNCFKVSDTMDRCTGEDNYGNQYAQTCMQIGHMYRCVDH